MLLTLSWRSFIKFQYSYSGVPLPHSNALPYYVKYEKFKVNDIIFPSGCEVRAIDLGNRNMKIGIFTGVTSVRSKDIFTNISRYPTGKHEIKTQYVAIHTSMPALNSFPSQSTCLNAAQGVCLFLGCSDLTTCPW